MWAGSILIAFGIARMMRPWIRNRWLIEFSRIDNYGYWHDHPSGRDLFSFGQVLNIRAYQEEWSDNAAYAWRVFKTPVRDPSRDHEVRPPNFQPFAALDNPHGYTSERPKIGHGMSWLGPKRKGP